MDHCVNDGLSWITVLTTVCHGSLCYIMTDLPFPDPPVLTKAFTLVRVPGFPGLLTSWPCASESTVMMICFLYMRGPL